VLVVLAQTVFTPQVEHHLAYGQPLPEITKIALGVSRILQIAEVVVIKHWLVWT